MQTGEGSSDRSDMEYQKSPAAIRLTATVTKDADHPDGVDRSLSIGGKIYVQTRQVPGKRWY
ncbi:hypothetical protein [Streptomyces sp. NPDC016845]|uniref:hypothetical protein n=1 Tax=Streptomyces sp. NPDC016845 TaxID=3364972 RepID=UPI0037B62AD7